MKSLKLNLVFLILSSCGILLWGLHTSVLVRY